jgi:hypothetical protein
MRSAVIERLMRAKKIVIIDVSINTVSEGFGGGGIVDVNVIALEAAEPTFDNHIINPPSNRLA